MKSIDVVFVRVYVMESSSLLKKVTSYLKNEAKIRGVSIFRAISGFSDKGDHTTSLIDLALDLPLAIEFFDSKEKIQTVLEYLSEFINHEHVVYWNAKAND